jgi:hypothetical protein
MFEICRLKNASHLLDNYWDGLMSTMFGAKISQGAFESGEMLSFTGSICDCLSKSITP